MATEKTTQPRKAYAPDGQRAQKMFTFRMDSENFEWLAQQPNKGRYINDLISRDRDRAES